MNGYFRRLRQNPIYLRETGRWGEPNPFFATLNRYSPFIILGTIFLSVCSCGSNFSQFADSNSNLVILWGLVCIPNLVMQALTWAGIILVPSLTAPAVSQEIKRGTWEILRLTPQSTWSILLAKMFGSLARLKIWWPMFLFSILQAAGAILGLFAVVASGDIQVEAVVSSIVLGIGYVVRPWAEIAYAAVVGMLLSTLTTSSRTALAGAYTAVVAMKVLNTSVLWGVIVTAVSQALSDYIIIWFTVMPLLVYLIATAILTWFLYRRSRQLDLGQAIGI